MIPSEMIIRKRDGLSHTSDEIREWIDRFTRGTIDDSQMAAWLMAVYWRGMTREETRTLVAAMRDSGSRVDLTSVSGKKIDKHSTGGVGDKTSILLAPLLASLGVRVPMISGRGLGHTGGTLDKLESIPGFRVRVEMDEFIRLVRTVGTAMIGQTADLAPADRRMYALRDVTGTIESLPLICGSILSKKLAAGIDGLVLDIKVGNGAFMKTESNARELAEWLVGISESMGVRTEAILTRMDQPLGRAVGNWLEVRECLDILEGGGPDDVRELTLELGRRMFQIAFPEESADRAREQCERNLRNGRAMDVFRQMVSAQGGDPRALEQDYPLADAVFDVPAPDSGYLGRMDTYGIGMMAVELGAGRMRAEDAIDPRVGMVFLKKLGDPVQRGEPWARVSAPSHADPTHVAGRLNSLLQIVKERPVVPGLIIGSLNASNLSGTT